MPEGTGQKVQSVIELMRQQEDGRVSFSRSFHRIVGTIIDQELLDDSADERPIYPGQVDDSQLSVERYRDEMTRKAYDEMDQV